MSERTNINRLNNNIIQADAIEPSMQRPVQPRVAAGNAIGMLYDSRFQLFNYVALSLFEHDTYHYYRRRNFAENKVIMYSSVIDI